MPAPDTGQRRRSSAEINIQGQNVLEEVARGQVTPETAGQSSGGIMYQGQAFQAKRSDTWQGINSLFNAGTKAAVAYKEIGDEFDRREKQEILDDIEKMKSQDKTDQDIASEINAKYGKERKDFENDPDVWGIRDGNKEWFTGLSNKLGSLSDTDKFRENKLEFETLGPDMSIDDKQQWLAKKRRWVPERSQYMYDGIESGLAQVKNDANVNLRKTAVVRDIYGSLMDGFFNGTYEEQGEWLDKVSEYPEVDEATGEIVPGTGGPFPGLRNSILNDPSFNADVYFAEHLTKQVHAASEGMSIDEIESTGTGAVNIERLQPQIDQITQWSTAASHSYRDKVMAEKSATALKTTMNVAKTAKLPMVYEGEVVDMLGASLGDIQGTSQEITPAVMELLTTSISTNLDGATEVEWAQMARWFPITEINEDGKEVTISPDWKNPTHRAYMASQLVVQQVSLLKNNVNVINPELSPEADNLRRKNSGLDRAGFVWDDDLKIELKDKDGKVTDSTTGGWVIPEDGLLSSSIQLAQKQAEDAQREDAMGDLIEEITHLANMGEPEQAKNRIDRALGVIDVQIDRGTRVDGSKKGPGHLGDLEMTDGSGRTMTEFSIGVGASDLGMQGTEEVLIPSIVPTLTKAEIDHLRGGGDVTPDIQKKAVEYAKERIQNGQSPFKEAVASPLEVNPTIQEEYQRSIRALREARREGQSDSALQAAIDRVSTAAASADLSSEDAIQALIQKQRLALATEVRGKFDAAVTPGDKALVQEWGKRAYTEIEPTVRLLAGMGKQGVTTASKTATAMAAASDKLDKGSVTARGELVQPSNADVANVVAGGPLGWNANTKGIESLSSYYGRGNEGIAQAGAFYDRAISQGSWYMDDGSGGRRQVTMDDVITLDPQTGELIGGIMFDDMQNWHKRYDMHPGEHYNGYSQAVRDTLLVDWKANPASLHAGDAWIATPKNAENLWSLTPEHAAAKVNFLMDGLVSEGQTHQPNWSSDHQSNLVGAITDMRNQSIDVVESIIEDGIQPDEISRLRPALAVLHAMDARSTEEGYQHAMTVLSNSLKTKATTSWTAHFLHEYKGHWGPVMHAAMAETNPADAVNRITSASAGLLSALIVVNGENKEGNKSVGRGKHLTGQLPTASRHAASYIAQGLFGPDFIDEHSSYWTDASYSDDDYHVSSPGRILAMTLAQISPLASEHLQQDLEYNHHTKVEMIWDGSENDNQGGWVQQRGTGQYTVLNDAVLKRIMLADTSFESPFADKNGSRGGNLVPRLEESGWSVKDMWEYYAAQKLSTGHSTEQLSERIRLSNLVNSGSDRASSHYYIDPSSPSTGLSRIMNSAENPAGHAQMPHSAMSRWHESMDIGGKGSGRWTDNKGTWNPNSRPSEFINEMGPNLTTTDSSLLGDASVPGPKDAPPMTRIGYTNNWNASIDYFNGLEDTRGRDDITTIDRITTVGQGSKKISLYNHLSPEEQGWLDKVTDTGAHWLLQERPPWLPDDKDWIPGQRPFVSPNGSVKFGNASMPYVYGVTVAGSVFVPQTSSGMGPMKSSYSLSNPSQLERMFLPSMSDVIGADDPATQNKEGDTLRAQFRITARAYSEAVYQINRDSGTNIVGYPTGSQAEMALEMMENVIIERNATFMAEIGYEPSRSRIYNASGNPIGPDPKIMTTAQTDAVREKALSYFKLPQFSDQGEDGTLTSLAVWSGFNHFLVDNSFGGHRELNKWHKERINGDPTRFQYIDMNVDFSTLDIDRGFINDEAQPTLQIRIGPGTVKLPITSRDIGPEQWGVPSTGGETKYLFHVQELDRAYAQSQQPQPIPLSPVPTP